MLPKWLETGERKPFKLTGGAVELQPYEASAPEPSVAAEDGTEPEPAAKPKLKKFSMDVYNGGIMDVAWYGRTVINIAGIDIPNTSVPAFQHHDPRRIVGHAEVTKTAKKVKAAGLISGASEAAQEVVDSSANGFPWQASISAAPRRLEFVKEGEKVRANGRTFQGPFTFIKTSTLNEVSFVPIGADRSTKTKVAATGKGNDMQFEKWVEAQGFDFATLTDGQRSALQAAFDAETAKNTDPEPKPATPVKASEPEPTPEPTADVNAAVAGGVKAERERVSGIEAACAGEWFGDAEVKTKAEEIRAAGIHDGESVADVNAKLIKVVREKRANVAASVSVEGGAMDARALEASVLLTHGTPGDRLLASYGEQTVAAGDKLRGMRLREVMAACCRIDGVNLPKHFGNGTEWIKAAFTSVSLAGILGNTANKTLLDAYRAVPSAARIMAARASVNDFKIHTRFRLTGDSKFELVSPGGELPHGTLDEQSFTQQAATRGKFFMLTRENIVNDDLGAFLGIPAKIGRGAALSLEEVFFTLLLSNPSSFFAAANNNFFDGAATVLQLSSLGTAVELFRKQTDPDGNPILLIPKFLVVPPELEVTAEELFKSVNLIAAGDTDVVRAQSNVQAGKYQPVVSPYLSNTGITGNSSTAWYLWGEPADVATMEIAYLNGVDIPTIEEVEAPANVLGKGFRGWMDFGVAMQDTRGAVKSKGAA